MASSLSTSSSSSSRSSKSLDVMYDLAEINIAEHLELYDRMNAALSKWKISLSDIEAYNTENRVGNAAESRIEKNFTPQDEIEELMMRHLNTTRDKEVKALNGIIGRMQRTMANVEDEKIRNEEIPKEREATYKKCAVLLPKKLAELASIQESLKGRVSVIEQLEIAGTYEELIALSYVEGIYYLFKYLYFSKKLTLPKQAINPSQVSSKSSSSTDTVGKQLAKIGGTCAAASNRTERLFESVKTQSVYHSNGGYSLPGGAVHTNIIGLEKLDFLGHSALRHFGGM